MQGARHYHDFYAPVGGVAKKFSVRCTNGAPDWIGAMEPLHVRGDGYPDEDITKLYRVIDLVNKLLRVGSPWALLLTHRIGDLGAVIEAAEARRFEIYGRLPESV